VRISLARLSASMRWARERSGATPEAAFGGDWAADGMGGDVTQKRPVVEAGMWKFGEFS
jgi:hypothetical protein